MTKQFNYKTATAEEIVQQFKQSSKQSIYNVRKYYKEDKLMTDRLNVAYKQYRVEKLIAELDSLSE